MNEIDQKEYENKDKEEQFYIIIIYETFLNILVVRKANP